MTLGDSVPIGVIILAGGKGTRLKPVVSDVPKVLAPVNNEPFLYWLINAIHSFGLNTIRLALGDQASMILDYLNAVHFKGVNISWNIEDSPRGTAGAIRDTICSSDSDVYPYWLVLNGDSLCTHDLSQFIKTAMSNNVDLAILTTHVDDASKFGSVVVDVNDRVTGFNEKVIGSSWVNSGVYLLKSDIAKQFSIESPLSMEYDVIPKLIQENCHVMGIRQQGEFLDIGTPESYPLAQSFIRSRMKRLQEAS